MPRVDLEPTEKMFERVKIFRPLYGTATMIGKSVT
jgi:hypothetical protein